MKHLKTALLIAGVGIFAVSGPSVVSAQEAAQEPVAKSGVAVRIAVIDIEAIQRNAKAVKSIRDQVDDYRKAFGVDAQKEDEELRKANEQLARQRAILAPEVFSEERKKFEQRVAEFQRNVQSGNRALDAVFTEAMKVVQKELNAVVVEIAKDFGLTLIVRKNMTILVATPLEATGEALKRLDAKLATVKVTDPKTLPAPAAK
jgi:outer membrane protein